MKYFHLKVDIEPNNCTEENEVGGLRLGHTFSGSQHLDITVEQLAHYRPDLFVELCEHCVRGVYKH